MLAFPHMRDAGGGSIINFGSSYGIRCEPGFLAYAASKEAIPRYQNGGSRMGQVQDSRQYEFARGDVAEGALVSQESGTNVSNWRRLRSESSVVRKTMARRSPCFWPGRKPINYRQRIGADGGSTMF